MKDLLQNEESYGKMNDDERQIVDVIEKNLEEHGYKAVLESGVIPIAVYNEVVKIIFDFTNNWKLKSNSSAYWKIRNWFSKKYGIKI